MIFLSRDSVEDRQTVSHGYGLVKPKFFFCSCSSRPRVRPWRWSVLWSRARPSQADDSASPDSFVYLVQKAGKKINEQILAGALVFFSRKFDLLEMMPFLTTCQLNLFYN
jgi:hypothetical protein